MPRAKRVLGDNITYHVVSNCNANEFLFSKGEHFEKFLNHLGECSQKFSFSLHAYCLMHSHIHLILTTSHGIHLDKVMYEICQRFSFQYNKNQRRSGHFWKNRYFCRIINNDIYGLVCLRYLHRNPVRAGLVVNPTDWPWSCVRFYTFGEMNLLLNPLPSYLGLAQDKVWRCWFYKNWLETKLISERSEEKLIQSKLKPQSRRSLKILQKEFGFILNQMTRM